MRGRLARLALRIILALVIVAALGLVTLVLVLRHPLPHGQPGPAADALARRIEAAVALPAWNKTGAVRWSFRGQHALLWDKTRDLVRVRWGADEVLLDAAGQRGHARHAGADVTDEKQAAALRKKAYALFINDSFWLMPFGKLFDPGVTRELVTMEGGEQALLVRFSSGGVTPGDSYLLRVDENGRPRAWRMWVKVLPIAGLEATWEDWRPLPTGATVSTLHKIAGRPGVTIPDVAAAATLAELEPGPDPFAALR